MTPSAIEVLLHYHVSPARHPRHDAPAVVEARERFIELGAITPAWLIGSSYVECLPGEVDLTQHDTFATTAKGKAWVEALCRTPYPEE